MDRVKRKIISQVCLAPSVVAPITVGAAAGLLAWSLNGPIALAAVAVLGIAGGVGWMVARLFYRVEDITLQALAAERVERLRQENQRLDELAKQLRTDRDHRTQDNLTLLRSLRDEFESIAENHSRLADARKGIELQCAQIREKLSLIFEAAVEQLRQSYRLWELSQSVAGSAREKALADREVVIQEMERTVERLRTNVQQFKTTLQSNPATTSLEAMHQDLEASLRIAQRTEERMREIENPHAAHEAFLRE